MPSKNERTRWELWFEQVDARMKRQKHSLDRVVLLLTEAIAALEEIAADDPVVQHLASDYRERAQQALERIKRPAAAVTTEVEESTKDEEPVLDPRRKQ